MALFLGLSGHVMGQDLSPTEGVQHQREMMVRLAVIEIHQEFLDEYLAILKEEAEASVRSEPGVLCIFPMYEREDPTQIRLLEIYADSSAYQAHLQSPHFKHYKSATLHMVKTLQLIDMEAIDEKSMPLIFAKIKEKSVHQVIPE
ncbi:Quinol monooxygenase YgiN [Muriicola jejuensis]|nr:antibiotic biosynthesis monooxygenase family protein [Muriicola jejuensis]SMP19279.1 Quinol monooxygenase YgiN [Muriicola jejuensis]